jgi:hypothetical protein
MHYNCICCLSSAIERLHMLLSMCEDEDVAEIQNNY